MTPKSISSPIQFFNNKYITTKKFICVIRTKIYLFTFWSWHVIINDIFIQKKKERRRHKNNHHSIKSLPVCRSRLNLWIKKYQTKMETKKNYFNRIIYGWPSKCYICNNNINIIVTKTYLFLSLLCTCIINVYMLYVLLIM